ncbi:hypothetical protein EJ110_NYTH53990 [Nymphaea thermarum]|nr:hypothetical protein EJ110_NYTH53979 [Nymphaea thermarum]KAF3774065.1 hypothetical protein EJ110_NYTH53990 [Nymphaea thermarum]
MLSSSGIWLGLIGEASRGISENLRRPQRRERSSTKAFSCCGRERTHRHPKHCCSHHDGAGRRVAGFREKK